MNGICKSKRNQFDSIAHNVKALATVAVFCDPSARTEDQ